MFVAKSTRPYRRSIALALIAILLASAASVASAQRLHEGPEFGGHAVRAPEIDLHARTVTVWPSAWDDTATLVEAITICSAARVGCTVTLTPGIYTLRRFDLTSFTGLLAVVGADVTLTGHFALVAPLTNSSGYLHSGHAGHWPAIVGFSFY